MSSWSGKPRVRFLERPAPQQRASAVLLLALLALPAFAVDVHLHVAVQGGESGQLSGLLTATPQPAATSAAPASIEKVIGTAEDVTLDLTARMTWSLHLDVDGYWSPETPLLPTADQEPVTIPVYPTGQITGRLALPGRDELPEDLDLHARFRTAGSRSGKAPLEGTVACTMAEKAFKCALPQGTLDVRLRAAGFVSHYLWGQAIQRAGSQDVGTLELERGASLVGWVESEDGRPAKGCSAVLTPEVSSRPSPAEEARSSILTVEAATDERGFFHLAGLLPGSYSLTVSKEGFAPARIPNLLLKENAEAELQQAVNLQRPLDLSIQVEPKLDPGGRRWALALFAAAGGDPVAMARCDASGRWTKPAMRPGSYRLMINDSRGARMATEELELRREQTTFTFELPLAAIEGRVTFGELPIAATLYFGGLHGEISIEAQADSEGEFSATIPRRDNWAIDVIASEPRIFRRLRDLVIDYPGSGPAWLDVYLPDTLLEGEVVNEEGEPLAEARLLLAQLPATEQPSYTVTDAEGKFSFHGLPYGTFRIEGQASSSEGALSSEPVEEELSEESPSASVRVVMRRMLRLAGRVSSTAGPVPGAALTVRPMEGQTFTMLPQAHSAGDGGFVLELPSGLRQIDLLAQAPGFVLQRLRTPLEVSTPLLITLHQEGGGSLVIELEKPLDFSAYFGRMPWIVHDATYLYSLSTLLNWARINGVSWSERQIVIPRMPAGDYRICWPAAPGESNRERCDGGFLPSGGKLVVDDRRP